MDAEGVLKQERFLRARFLGAVLLVAFALLRVSPVAAEEEGARPLEKRRATAALLQPRRVTVGDHNHFMGVLGPGARYLYYVTDEFNAYDLYVQSPLSSSGEPLFEAFGDVIWPAISQDGKEVGRASTDLFGEFKIDRLAPGSGSYQLAVSGTAGQASLTFEMQDESLYLGAISLAAAA